MLVFLSEVIREMLVSGFKVMDVLKSKQKSTVRQGNEE